MRNLKKFLALVLAMMMTLSLMVTVNATNVEFDDGESVNDAFIDDLTVLAGMGVIQGMDDGNFAPTSTVTRAQMAAIVYRLRTGDASADPEYKDKSNMYAGYGDFKDVDDSKWFAGYVGYCANAGIIIGDGDGNFRPNHNVTGYEALVMLLRAMGYNQPNEFTGKDWRQHAASIATQRGLLNKVNTTVYRGTLMNGAAREVIAEITFQAANQAQVVYTAAFGYQTTGISGGVTGTTENPTLGYQYYGLASESSIILGNQATGESCTLLGVDSVEYEDAAGATHTADTTYMYPGTQLATTAVTPNAAAAIDVPTGLKLAGNTGLDLFGHAVEAWYNAKDPAAAKETYAILDRASLSATVFSPTATHGTKLSDGTKTNALLGLAAQKAGFSVDLATAEAHTSDAYDRITTATAVAADGTAGTDTIFALISNNSDKTVDVIVTLNPEVAQITQKNTISTTQTLTLGNAGGSSSSFGATGVINIKSLVEGSETTLGAKVAAWEVKGTNDSTAYNTDSTTDGVKGTNSNMPYYELNKLTKTTTGTVLTYDADDRLTLSDGTVIEQSWMYGKIIDGAFTTPNPWAMGVTYTIYLDDEGRWLGATSSSTDFLYGTFADFEVGALGTGTIKYTVTGVNWDGEKVINHVMTSLYDGAQAYPGTTPANKTLADGYNTLTISKKDLGTSAGGNQIEPGIYTGYMIDAEGKMDTTGLKGTLLNAAGKTWTIEKKDVANGFADLNTPKDGKLLATAATKFILVSGTGSSDLDVKIYNGISELLQGYDKVVLNADSGNNPYGNTYYLMASDRFNKWDTTDNTLVDTVILDARDLTYTGAKTLYFAPNNNVTTVKLAGADATNVDQYVLYNNGEKGTYFVDKDGATAPTGADANGSFFELTKAYEVNGVPVYKATAVTTAAGGQETLANGGICNVNLGYNYVGVNNLNTAQLGTEIFNVTNAKVVDVEYNPVTCTHTEITSVKDLNDAVSGLTAYSGGIKVAAVYSGVNVSVIYVTTVPNP